MEDHPLSDKQVREKLIARGASALTDTELLSILLHGSGPGGPAFPATNCPATKMDLWS